MTIPHIRFAVDEEPFCVWEHDLRERNLRFLEQVDPGFFEYLADVHWEEDDLSQRAAVALRLAYGHGLETLFALLCAAIQAPDCVVGWLQRYSIRDIESLIRKLRIGAPVLTKLRVDAVSWKSVARIVHAPMDLATAKKDRLSDLFATCWAGQSFDLLDPIARREFNSIKHGLRVSPGGFVLAMGLEDEPGVPAPPERMKALGGSDFGSSFFVAESLHGRRHFRVKSHSRNWCPQNFAYGLKLIAMSVNNVLAFLRIANGAERAEYRWPEDETMFEAYRHLSPGVTSANMDTVVAAADTIEYTPDEILAVYRSSPPEDDRATGA